MTTKVRVAIAFVGAYLLGRMKKFKLAIAWFGLITGTKLSLSPSDLLAQGAKLVESSPQLGRLLAALQGPLLDAAKTAAVSAATHRLEGVTDQLVSQVENLGKPAAAAGQAATDAAGSAATAAGGVAGDTATKATETATSTAGAAGRSARRAAGGLTRGRRRRGEDAEPDETDETDEPGPEDEQDSPDDETAEQDERAEDGQADERDNDRRTGERQDQTGEDTGGGRGQARRRRPTSRAADTQASRRGRR